MPLCEYFLASAAELKAVAESGSPDERLTKVDAKGFDVIAIEALAKRLRVKKAVDEGEPIVHGEGFEWFAQRVTEPMQHALEKLSAKDIAGHAKALAKEVDWSATEISKLLTTLSEMAVSAKKQRKSLYMWVCC
jgi:HAMP domain-containing protein